MPHGKAKYEQLHTDVGTAFLEEMVRELPHRSRIYDQYNERRDLFTQDEKDKAFAEAAVIVKGYSDELVTRWSSEIDTYLVYAGLFSAILTAFNVESYQLLQPVSPDPTSVVLQHISLQLSSLSHRPPFINSSYPAFDAADSSSARPPVIPVSAIWLNTLWFSSLVLSLSSASVGILVKQWLNEYQSGLSGDSQHIAYLRQYRLNNLKRCHVGSIVVAIPVLLQVALALFLAGILVLLWNLHRTVAAVTSAFIAAIASFIIVTTVLPRMTTHCAFVSPQSLALHALWAYLVHLTHRVVLAIRSWLCNGSKKDESHHRQSDNDKPSNQSRPGREHSIISDYHTARELEADMFGTAYGTTFNSSIVVSATARMVDWQPAVVLRWAHNLVDIDLSHFGALRDHFWSDKSMLGAISWCNIVLCSTQAETRGNWRFTRALEVAAIELQRCLRQWLVVPLKHSCANETDRGAPWWRKTCWLLTTTLVLISPECEPSNSCPCARLEWPVTSTEAKNGLREELERNCLSCLGILFSRSSDREAEREDITIVKLRTCAALGAAAAIRGIQRSGYSPHVPLDGLRDFLHPCAHLLCAVAAYEFSTRDSGNPRQSSTFYARDSLHDGARRALSGLKLVLHCLAHQVEDRSHSILREGEWFVQYSLLAPMACIVHTLSAYIDVFRPLLPSQFAACLEAFIRAVEGSGISTITLWCLYVPWTRGLTLSDLYDESKGLITKLRDQDYV